MPVGHTVEAFKKLSIHLLFVLLCQQMKAGCHLGWLGFWFEHILTGQLDYNAQSSNKKISPTGLGAPADL